MSGEYIADIVIGKNDFSSHEITDVYSEVTGTYVVYANAQRIMVQYSDDTTLAKDQRLALAHLAPLRGEINGLIDGWRLSWNMARFYRLAIEPSLFGEVFVVRS